MRQSNVVLEPYIVKFLRELLQPKGYGGYFFVDWAGSAGSGRKFYRLRLNVKTTVILMIWEGSDPDWDYFLEIDRLSFPMIPKIIGYDRELGLAVVEDGGSRRCRDLLFSGISEYKKEIVIDSILKELNNFHSIEIPQNSILHNRALDYEMFIWESDYFREHMSNLIPSILALFDDNWEKEREQIAQSCDRLSKVLIHRDFQSENIVIRNKKVSFVDIQGARFAPKEYDYASFLYDPYLYPTLSDELREKIINNLVEDNRINRDTLNLCAIQRLMQALGAYGNLSLNKGKPHYKKFVFPAFRNLEIILRNGNYPYLKNIVDNALKLWNR